jgi:penicillin-binding protein 2
MSEDRHFKDHHREASIFTARMVVMSILMLSFFGVLVYRYHHLQIVQYQDYVTRSDRNRVHVQPIAPTRGLIYDHNNILLAENRPSYTLSVIRERAGELSETLELLQQLVDVSTNDLEKFTKAMHQRRRPFEPVPLRYNLTEAELASLAVNEYRLEGVEVDAQLVRYYPLGDLFAHTVGYVGRINEAELSGFDEDEYRRYSGTHSIGKNGLERSYESLLLGEVGNQNVETNARGRVQRVLDRTDPKPGSDLHLYLDVKMQQTATAALAGRRGAVVAIDVKTGGVVAAVSLPSYDPNLFVTGISFADYRSLNESLDMPLYNRFIQGTYPPGSTVKPIVALAGLHTGFTTASRTISDPGFFRLPNTEWIWRDWKRGGHGGRVDLLQAMAESCDTYFYELGSRMGVDHMSEFGSYFGLGELTHIDIPSERKGVWPSREWKRAYKGQVWYPGDTVNMSIGQGFVLTSPLQLAVMTATIANRGIHIRPQIVKTVGERPLPPIIEDKIDVAPAHWDAIFESMAEVMHGKRGTARTAGRDSEYRMAGKSGTAQVVGIAQGEKYDSEALKERHRDHALFVSFAPLDDPQIAVAVIIENAEGGSSQAGPVARKMMDAYLLGKYLTPDELPASADHTPVHASEPEARMRTARVMD